MLLPVSELRKAELKRLGAVSKVSKEDRESLVLSAGGFSERGKHPQSHCPHSLSIGSPMQTLTVYGRGHWGKKTGRGLKPHPLGLL